MCHQIGPQHGSALPISSGRSLACFPLCLPHIHSSSTYSFLSSTSYLDFCSTKLQPSIKASQLPLLSFASWSLADPILLPLILWKKWCLRLSPLFVLEILSPPLPQGLGSIICSFSFLFHQPFSFKYSLFTLVLEKTKTLRLTYAAPCPASFTQPPFLEELSRVATSTSLSHGYNLALVPPLPKVIRPRHSQNTWSLFLPYFSWHIWHCWPCPSLRKTQSYFVLSLWPFVPQFPLWALFFPFVPHMPFFAKTLPSTMFFSTPASNLFICSWPLFCIMSPDLSWVLPSNSSLKLSSSSSLWTCRSFSVLKACQFPSFHLVIQNRTLRVISDSSSGTIPPFHLPSPGIHQSSIDLTLLLSPDTHRLHFLPCSLSSGPPPFPPVFLHSLPAGCPASGVQSLLLWIAFTTIEIYAEIQMHSFSHKAFHDIAFACFYGMVHLLCPMCLCLLPYRTLLGEPAPNISP